MLDLHRTIQCARLDLLLPLLGDHPQFLHWGGTLRTAITTRFLKNLPLFHLPSYFLLFSFSYVSFLAFRSLKTRNSA